MCYYYSYYLFFFLWIKFVMLGIVCFLVNFLYFFSFGFFIVSKWNFELVENCNIKKVNFNFL